MKKKILAASVAAVMMGSAGIATADLNIADKGQLLLSPVFVADSAHSTNIAIWNTSDQQAVKAKIVFRSHCDSAEVLDFIIYLTPADVWRGSVVFDGTTARLVTADDSSKIEADVGQGSAWNNVVPANFPLYTAKLTPRPSGGLTSSCYNNDDGVLTIEDSNSFGHFEVIGVYSVDLGDYVTDDGDVTVERTMTKEDLASILDDTNANSGPWGGRPDNDITVGPGAVGVQSFDPTKLNIAGRVDVVSTSGERSSFNIPALASPSMGPYPFFDGNVDNFVISNDQYDANTGADSFIGVNFADSLAGSARVVAGDNIGLIEAALADQAEQWAYESDADSETGVVASAPTRYRHIGVEVAGACGNVTPISDSVNQYSAPFALNTGSIQYTLKTYDNSENLVTSVGGATSGGVGSAPDTLPNETNYLTPAYAFESGMSEMGWAQQNAAGCTYVGMPMLVTTFRYEAAGNYEINHAVTKGGGMVGSP